MTSVVSALGLEAPPGLVSIVGGGGKSSLLFALGRELPGRVVMTTTTRIFAAQMDRAPQACTLADPEWRRRLESFEESLLVVGAAEGERAVGVPTELPGQLLEHPRVDWVVVEADGSRMRPVKAPGDHEPVVPVETSLLVAVAGIDALAAPIAEVAHRPERVCEITGLAPEQALPPESLAALLTSRDGGLKGAPPGARAVVLINKVELAQQREAARRVARCALREPRLDRVLIGALQPRGSSWQAWEIVQR
ncbi:MAG: selenium cofactor biosynthesis protein YqeC [Myxococcota bacterium]